MNNSTKILGLDKDVMSLPDLIPDVNPKNPPMYEPDEFDDYNEEEEWKSRF